METKFKKILAVIDLAAENDNASPTLFSSKTNITLEDKYAFEEWAEKPVECIKEFLSPAWAKKQIVYNPFVNDRIPGPTSIIFSKFDESDKPAIFFQLEDTIYGQVMIASTDRGICYLVFFNGTESNAHGILEKEFPNSKITCGLTEHHNTALSYIRGEHNGVVKLHVKGTPANLDIWKALTLVPSGKLISYGTLAKATHQMAQDIGISMGDNRIAILIPCHRVIKSTGDLGQYHWGTKRKRAMIIKEAFTKKPA
ncbi:MAG TPA: methylated-DNA--[protein]-cysteine S-methyltransferase [Puia sp.]